MELARIVSEGASTHQGRLTVPKLYGRTGSNGVHIGDHTHQAKSVKGVVDPEWGVDCAQCAPHLRKMGWVDDPIERPKTKAEVEAEKRARDRAHLTAEKSQALVAEVLAKLVDQQSKK